jgi:hypothetical protein
MKPHFEDAPEWANYMAMDADGTWWWFQAAPRLDEEESIWGTSGGQSGVAMVQHEDWKETLEARPK